MHTFTFRCLIGAVFAASVATVAGLSGPIANAASATTTSTTRPSGRPPQSDFCRQLRVSTQVLAGKKAGTKEANTAAATEWATLAKLSPKEIKADVSAIAVSYRKASTQADAEASKTISAIAPRAKKVQTYATQNCQGGGGRGGGTRNNVFNSPEFRACVEKEGGTLPTIPTTKAGSTVPEGTRPAGGRRQGGGPGGNLDAKTQAAIEKCRAQLGLPAGGGRATTTTTVKKK